LLVAGAAVLAIAALVVTRPWASSGHGATSPRESQASFQAAANAKCDADYAAALPKARAFATDPAVLIQLSEAEAEKLSADVAAVPHPSADDAKLRTVKKATDEVVQYLRSNATALAQPSSSSAAAASAGLRPAQDLRDAYLALGLDQCVTPNIPGAPSP
jgi:hypothetical protein